MVEPLIKAAKAEPGNLAYTFYQNVHNPSEFIVYEEYTNKDAFDEHCKTAHFQHFAQHVQPLLAKEMDLQVF